MINQDKITDVFCLIDEFCQEYDQIVFSHLLGNKVKRPSKIAMSEVITTPVLFHLSGFRTFKHFYIFYVQKHM